MLRNILAVIIGIIAGGVVNMGLVMLGSSIISAPAGVDMTNMESIKASAHLFETKHFLFPFLGHAVGTLVGALIASLIALTPKMFPAFVVGGFFLLGGIVAAFMIPAPFWFLAADLLIAYLPMAWLGWKLSGRE